MLQVDPDATADELKRAYRRAARTWHPDRNPAPEAEERFKEVAAAWEILGDPTQRRRHGLTSARANRGILPEEFLLDVADAIERAETWIREGVLPHYARYWRGHGSELATRIFRDLDALLAPQQLEPAGWWSRRQVQRRADRIVVTTQFGHSHTLSVVRIGRDVAEVVILPNALWDAGLREPATLDDAVMHLLLARFAQGLGPGRVAGPDGDWDLALADARAHDQVKVSATRMLVAKWTVVGVLLVVMFTAAFNGW